MANKHAIYNLLMWLVVPCILFIFIILFGNGSYQLWGDRFHYFLTDRYLFSHMPSSSMLSPLWRDDILCGSVWATSLQTTPLALDLLLGRIFALSPLGIEIVGSLFLYFVSIAGMYPYVRQVIQTSIESATLAAVLFGVATYWSAFWTEGVEFPMAVAWLPALLIMTHQIDAVTQLRQSSGLLPMTGFALLFFGCAATSSIATWPFILLILFLYTFVIFGLTRTSTRILLAALIGLLLFSPYLWQLLEAALFSQRYFGFEHEVPLENRLIFFLRQIMTSHNIFGLSLPAKLGLIMWCTFNALWSREPSRIHRILKFAGWLTIIGYAVYCLGDIIQYALKEIPILGVFHVDRLAFFSSFGVIVILGWTFDRWQRKREDVLLSRSRQALGQAIYAALATLTIGHIIYVANKIGPVPSSIAPQYYVLYGLFLLYSLGTFLTLLFFYRNFFSGYKSGYVQLLPALMIVTVSLDASVHAYTANISVRPGMFPSQPLRSYAERYSIPAEILEIKNLAASYGRVVVIEPLPRKNAFEWATGLLPTMSLAGIKTAEGYSAMYPRWYHRLAYTAINGVDSPSYRRAKVIIDEGPALRPDLLALLNVGVILSRGRQNISGYFEASRFDSAGTSIYLIQDHNRIGPAFVSSNVKCFRTDDEALHYIRNSAVPRLKADAPLVTSDTEASKLCNEMSDSGSAQSMKPEKVSLSRSTDRVTIEVDSSGGILTLSETFYPGWVALVDGQERPLLRTYTALRGVQISAGHHVVDFTYKPTAYLFLHRVSIIILLILLASLCLSLMKKGGCLLYYNTRLRLALVVSAPIHSHRVLSWRSQGTSVMPMGVLGCRCAIPHPMVDTSPPETLGR